MVDTSKRMCYLMGAKTQLKLKHNCKLKHNSSFCLLNLAEGVFRLRGLFKLGSFASGFQAHVNTRQI